MWGNPLTVRNIPSARCFHPHPWKFLEKSVPSFLCCWRPQLGPLFLSAGSLAGFLQLIQIPGRAFALPTERVRKPPNDKLVKCENVARAAYVCSCLDTSQVCAYLSPREGLGGTGRGRQTAPALVPDLLLISTMNDLEQHALWALGSSSFRRGITLAALTASFQYLDHMVAP